MKLTWEQMRMKLTREQMQILALAAARQVTCYSNEDDYTRQYLLSRSIIYMEGEDHDTLWLPTDLGWKLLKGYADEQSGVEGEA